MEPDTLSPQFPYQDVQGLLSPDIQGNARQYALLSAAQGLLAGSAPSRVPGAFARGLAGGLGGLNQGYQQGISMGMNQQKFLQQQQGIAATKQMLIQRGMSPAQADTLALNPGIADLFKPTVSGADFAGNPLYSTPVDIMRGAGTSNSPLIGQGGATAAGAAGAPGSNMLGQVENYFGAGGIDHSKTGYDYLSQFAPEVQSAVRNWIAGDTTPASNPRKGFTQAIQILAKKVGEEEGIPVSEPMIKARQEYLVGLNAKDQPNSPGGQRLAYRTALDTLDKTLDKIVALNPSSGVSIPGISPSGVPITGNIWNAVRNNLSNDQQDKLRAIDEGVQVFSGDIGKLNYGNSGGGEHEREAIRGRFAGSSTGPQFAGAAEAARDMIVARGQQLKQQRDQLFSNGLKAPNGATFDEDPEMQKALANIQNKVDILRGKAVPGAPGYTPTGTTAGAPAAPAAPSKPAQAQKIDWPAENASRAAAYAKIPPGTWYIDPNGVQRFKPNA
jgi:hypothetical protein